jgi:hypothetical protein
MERNLDVQLQDLNEDIEINLIDYYSEIKLKLNKDIIQIIDDPQSNLNNDELNDLREFGDVLINKTNLILQSSLDEIEQYFLNLKKLNQLFCSTDDLNNFFEMDNEQEDKKNIKIDEESIIKCALTKYVIYISKSKLNPKSVASHKKPGVFIVFDYYPNTNQRNYIKYY